MMNGESNRKSRSSTLRARAISFHLKIAALILFAVALLPFGFESAKGQTTPANNANTVENFCAVCHSDTQVEFRESAHQREGIKCIDCHGGDPTAQTVEGAHSKGFRPSLDRKQIVELCSNCHSDPVKMKPYGIPTDQRALYFTSVHGRRLIEGDSRVAVCSDCHGVHRVLTASDPGSSVFPENIPQTCGRCHEDAEMMKDYNISTSVISDYRQSVHGQALLERHNRQSPDCTRCHGTHGAAPPGVGDVAKVCGQCHTNTLEFFRQSPHQAAMEANGQAGCASCHGNHLIERAGHQMWSSSCSKCHDSGSMAADRGKTIQELFLQAESELEKAKLSIEDAKRIPLEVSDYEARLSDALTYLVEARPLSHNVSVEDVDGMARRSRSIALEVQADISDKMNVFRGRFIVLSLVWFYIIISIAAIVRVRRLLERRKAGKAEYE